MQIDVLLIYRMISKMLGFDRWITDLGIIGISRSFGA
jgi:hypothetical protein